MVVAPTPADGVKIGRVSTGPDGFTLVVGSDYLVGELLRPSGSTEEPDLSDPGVTGSPPETEPEPDLGPTRPGRVPRHRTRP